MSEHVHHHGLLAGIGAGAMAVLVIGGGLLWMAWHRIAGAVGSAFTVIVWAAAAAVLAAVAYGVVFLVLRLRLHARQPGTLTRHTVRAEILNPAAGSEPAAALEPAAAAALPRETHMHVHLPPGMAPEAVAAALRAVHPALVNGQVPGAPPGQLNGPGN